MTIYVRVGMFLPKNPHDEASFATWTPAKTADRHQEPCWSYACPDDEAVARVVLTHVKRTTPGTPRVGRAKYSKTKLLFGGYTQKVPRWQAGDSVVVVATWVRQGKRHRRPVAKLMTAGTETSFDTAAHTLDFDRSTDVETLAAQIAIMRTAVAIT